MQIETWMSSLLLLPARNVSTKIVRLVWIEKSDRNVFTMLRSVWTSCTSKVYFAIFSIFGSRRSAISTELEPKVIIPHKLGVSPSDSYQLVSTQQCLPRPKTSADNESDDHIMLVEHLEHSNRQMTLLPSGTSAHETLSSPLAEQPRPAGQQQLQSLKAPPVSPVKLSGNVSDIPDRPRQAVIFSPRRPAYDKNSDTSLHAESGSQVHTRQNSSPPSAFYVPELTSPRESTDRKRLLMETAQPLPYLVDGRFVSSGFDSDEIAEVPEYGKRTVGSEILWVL